MLFSQLVKNCLDIVLPQCCAVCGVRIPVGQTGMVCGSCNSGMRYLAAPFCRICGMEVFSAGSHKPLCGECLRHPPPYLIARSVVLYESQIQRLVQKLKYGRDLSVIPAIKALAGLESGRSVGQIVLRRPAGSYSLGLVGQNKKYCATD